MSAAPERPEPGLVEFLRDIVTSPDGAVFAVLTRSARRAEVDVIGPMREITQDGMRRSGSGAWLVFGRRLYLVDRADRLRGINAHGIWLHSRPDDVPFELVMSRLVEGGQLRG